MTKKNIIRLKIDSYTDRQKMVESLANSGYPVWVEEKDSPNKISNDYYVCYERTN